MRERRRIFVGMRRLIGSAVLVGATLALSARGDGYRVVFTIGPGPVLFHSIFPPRLWKPIRAEARGVARSLRGGRSVKIAQVYGPNSRYLLVKASSGDLVKKTASERKGFYLIVLHGHFVCHSCSRPSGSSAKSPRGKIATEVWSPKAGETDFGLSNRPVAMSHLRGPTAIQISGGGPALAHAQAKYYGDPDATIASVEKVRISGARPGHERWKIFRMKSSHGFRVGCPSPRPGPAGPCDAHYLEVGIDLANHKVGLDWGLTASEVSAIARARQASRWFRFFPDTTALYLRCAIPRGGTQVPTSRSLTGTCSTVADPSNHVRRVVFVETFRLSPSAKLSEAGWVVSLSRTGRVQSIRVTGQPPQLWK